MTFNEGCCDAKRVTSHEAHRAILLIAAQPLSGPLCQIPAPRVTIEWFDQED